MGRLGQPGVEGRVEGGDVGRSGEEARPARMVAAAIGLWSGARSASASIAATTPSSATVAAVNRSPPWTTR